MSTAAMARRVASIACVAAGMAAVAAAAAQADGPVALSSTPIAEDPAWSSYVLATGAPDVTPVRVVSTSGSVTNADGLVDPSKGPATLTYTAGQPAPTIVLDYGREVGGLPFFNLAGVTPSGTATTVWLRAGYSEARQYLFAGGSTTLSLGRRRRHELKVGAVTNFFVGDTVKVDNETATISARYAVAVDDAVLRPAGATNVKVRHDGHRSATRCRRNDSVTVTTVGTQVAPPPWPPPVGPPRQARERHRARRRRHAGRRR